MWVGYPSHGELWEADLEAAQAEVAALVRTLAGPGAEQVKLMACGEAALADARSRLAGVAAVEIIPGVFGDVWLRDTGPIFRGDGVAVAFAFNGWGGKYVLAGDETVAGAIARAAGAPLERHAAVMEGGALDHDGAGTVLTTRQCLLNANRNPGWTEGEAEAALARGLGAKRVVWLGDGLINDHTDGHVDNLARFVRPGVVACPIAVGGDDVNAETYDTAARALAEAELQVVRIPSPGRIASEDARLMPASHMNFVIANGAAVVPIFAEDPGALAVRALEALFPYRQVIGLPSRALLTGGGSFHCITQQEPA
jgi:agmatine deiminase